ncbi:IPP transferase-domain-containing protein [Scenedesmus sp. NREL 46B-D3]|nr:IPP transferase-domain-containing protein [Scenedesmus sp. NREL 46B-D3]
MHGQQHRPQPLHLQAHHQQQQQQQQQQQHAFSSSSSSSAAWQAAPPGRPRIIIITGPTAVGKTRLGLELAKRLDGEIISADSVQVYKGLDVGSDKLPVAEREGIPHHLIDILPPDAEFSAGDFHQLGRKAAEDIIQATRGKTPIVVGGTGFYLRWFIHGKAATPPSNPQTAAEARALVQQAWDAAAAERWELAVDVVQQLGDAATAARVRAERNNWYRLQRVLQILLQNGGTPLSEMDVDTTKPLDYDFRCFFLTRPRIELYDTIAFRVEEMVAGGLLPEALLLLRLGMSPNSHVATKAIGYRQGCEFMQAALRDGAVSPQQLRQLILDIATASRNLVKNQTTWFRDDDLFRWGLQIKQPAGPWHVVHV